ncbi:MAG: hypothetical protein E7315_02960 [Clostridiales bacterium]|nr:hypothetical protein [Clostridiales bacterium]
MSDNAQKKKQMILNELEEAQKQYDEEIKKSREEKQVKFFNFKGIFMIAFAALIFAIGLMNALLPHIGVNVTGTVSQVKQVEMRNEKKERFAVVYTFTTRDGEKTGNYTVTFKVKDKENVVIPEEGQSVQVRYYEKLSMINCVTDLNDERPSLGVWMCVISLAIVGVQILSYKLKIS